LWPVHLVVQHLIDCRSVDQSISWSVDQSISRSVDQSISRSVDQSISWSVYQSISLSVNQSISLSVDQSISRSVDQSISRSVDQSISQSVNQSISQSVDQSISRSVDQSISRSNFAPRFQDNIVRKIIFSCLTIWRNTLIHAVSFVCESSSHKKNVDKWKLCVNTTDGPVLASQFIICLVTFGELFTTVKTFYMCMYTYQSKLGSGIFEIECHKLNNLGI
jgi:hypothetical protein